MKPWMALHVPLFTCLELAEMHPKHAKHWAARMIFPCLGGARMGLHKAWKSTQGQITKDVDMQPDSCSALTGL